MEDLGGVRGRSEELKENPPRGDTLGEGKRRLLFGRM